MTASAPMPPTITPEQQAVLDAADAQEQTCTKLDWQPPAEVRRTHEAVCALRAAQQPLDPTTELRVARKEEQDALFKYLREVERGRDMADIELLRNYDRASKRVEAAIAALEGKS